MPVDTDSCLELSTIFSESPAKYIWSSHVKIARSLSLAHGNACGAAIRARRLRRTGGVLGAEFAHGVVVVDFQKDALARVLERAEVVLAVRVAVLGDGSKPSPWRGWRPGPAGAGRRCRAEQQVLMAINGS
jgi:hypothetical protein